MSEIYLFISLLSQFVWWKIKTWTLFGKVQFVRVSCLGEISMSVSMSGNGKSSVSMDTNYIQCGCVICIGTGVGTTLQDSYLAAGSYLPGNRLPLGVTVRVIPGRVRARVSDTLLHCFLFDLQTAISQGNLL